MEELLKFFNTAFIRDYKGGKEIRTNNLEASLHSAQQIIERRNLQVDIIDKNPILKSFTIKERE